MSLALLPHSAAVPYCAFPIGEKPLRKLLPSLLFSFLLFFFFFFLLPRSPILLPHFSFSFSFRFLFFLYLFLFFLFLSFFYFSFLFSPFLLFYFFSFPSFFCQRLCSSLISSEWRLLPAPKPLAVCVVLLSGRKLDQAKLAQIEPYFMVGYDSINLGHYSWLASGGLKSLGCTDVTDRIHEAFRKDAQMATVVLVNC